MRSAILMGLALFATGCTFGVAECQNDGDCTPGVCVSNFCVLPDAGTGGGGGGGAVTGGGAGGGGGSTTLTCTPSCLDGRSCQQTGAGKLECLLLDVALLTPDAGTYQAGETLRVVATVKNADGSAWDGATVPLTTTPDLGPNTLTRVASGRYEGAVALPLTAGMLTLTAGWTGAEATVTVVTEACSPAQAAMCKEWQACVPNANGGDCEATNPVLTWAAPDAGMRVAGGVALPLKVQVSVMPTSKGAKVYPQTVPVVRVGSSASAVLTQTGVGMVATYEGTIDPGMTEGDITLTAGWSANAATQKSVSVYVDTQPPEVGLFAAGGPVYIRDSLVVAALTSNEPLADAGLRLAGVPMERRPLSECAGLAGGRGVVDCFALDFSKPALNALDGGFDALLTATDLFGHTVNGADGGMHLVTRVRWTTTLSANRVQSTAVGSDGTLYAGISVGSGTGELVALAPDGGVGPRAGIGDVQAIGIGVGAMSGGRVFVGYNTATSTGRGFVGAMTNALDAGDLVGACTGAPASQTHSGLALFQANGRTLALGSANQSASGDGTGLLFDVNGSCKSFGTATQFDSAVVPTKTEVASNVLVSSSSAYFLAQYGGKAWWQPVALNGTSTPTTPVAAIEIGADSTSYGAGQLLTDGGVLIGGAGATSRLVYWMTDAGTPANSALARASDDKGTPVAASAVEAYVGVGDSLVRFNPQSLVSMSSTPVSVASDSIRVAPVLGSIPTDGGTPQGYAVSKNGQLAVFGHSTASSSQLWRSALGGQVVAHPSFDCNRARPNSGTGVLYVGTTDGRVLSIIVDSPKLLDTPGAWPKYQRSMGNAGNDDLVNFPTNWPGCP